MYEVTSMNARMSEDGHIVILIHGLSLIRIEIYILILNLILMTFDKTNLW